jgi:ABC-type nitrate/sulfonate/bicarbonate transport system substrate-binding protein
MPIRLSLAMLLGLALAVPAGAETIRVGRPQAQGFSFLPLEIGRDSGIYAQHGLTLDIISFQGSAKLHQGMAAGAVDIGTGSGPEMAFVAKGSPEITVAMSAGPPLLLAIVVPYDSPMKSADDLKGKKIGVSSVGSLTAWLGLELAHAKGWGPNGVTIVPTGGEWTSQFAAMKTGQTDAMLVATAFGFQTEEQHKGRVLVPCASYVSDFIAHAHFASNAMVKDHPDQVKRFLAGWFDTIHFMRANRDETIKIARQYTGFSQAVEEREYDVVMPMFSGDGHFDAKGLDTLRRSLVDLGMVDAEPDMAKLYTEKFLPD